MRRRPRERALEPEALIGAWSLVDFRVRFSDGRPSLAPFGERARGRIVYGADGYMAAVLSRDPVERVPGAPGAARVATNTLETTGRLSVTEKATAFDSYLSYTGRWRLEGDVVVHTVDLALAPGVAGEQRRRVRLDGGAMTLTYQRTPRSGVTRTYTLIWRREPRGALQ